LSTTAGEELWKSDGTASGTVMVKDINPGVANSGIYSITAIGNTVYFVASDGTNGFELWKSDGTSSGTVMVKDINAGSVDSAPANLTVMGSTLYFSANTAANGYELWKSDGTSSGTVMVKDITPGTDYSAPTFMTVVGSTLYFRATTPTNGYELWKSDGTSSGTVLVKDIVTGSGSAYVSSLINVNGTLFFSAATSSGYELWKSDGTSSGTVMVKDINTGSGDSFPGHMLALGSTLYFEANTSTSGYELWKSDGTSSGTVQVKDIVAGTDSSYPDDLTALGNSVYYFSATTTGNGYELWKSDGTSSGTVMVKDIVTGAGDSFPDHLTVVGSTLYFRAWNATTGYELWKSDGTAAGTVQVKDINPGISDSMPDWLVTVGGILYFTADDGSHGKELWKVDARRTDIYYTDGWQAIEERQGNDVRAQYAYSPVYIDAMIERDRDTNADGTTDERLYVLQDANFNVTAIASTAGSVVERFQYDSYGARSVLSASWVGQAETYGFMQGHQGGKIDVVTGYVHFRNREMNTAQMRWMQQDPLSYLGGGDLYESLGSSPNNLTDPRGTLQGTEEEDRYILAEQLKWLNQKGYGFAEALLSAFLANKPVAADAFQLFAFEIKNDQRYREAAQTHFANEFGDSKLPIGEYKLTNTPVAFEVGYYTFGRFGYPSGDLGWALGTGHFGYTDATIHFTNSPDQGKRCFSVELTMHQRDPFAFAPGKLHYRNLFDANAAGYDLVKNHFYGVFTHQESWKDTITVSGINYW
jgi:RHS repeat-associated protein